MTIYLFGIACGSFLHGSIGPGLCFLIAGLMWPTVAKK